MTKLLEKLKVRVSFAAVHGLAHLAYFGAVFVEGHGVYAMMGGVLLGLGLLALVLRKGGTE